jgi:hypothetical protein
MGTAIIVALGWLGIAGVSGVVVARLGEAGGVEDAHRAQCSRPLGRFDRAPGARDGCRGVPGSQLIGTIPSAEAGVSMRTSDW